MTEPQPAKPGPPVVSSGLGIFAGLLFLLGLFHSLAAAYEWLRYGTGFGKTVRQAWLGGGTRPQFDWVGIQKIVDWYLDSNAGVTFMLTGLALGLISSWVYDAGEADRSAYRAWQWQQKRDAEQAEREAERKEQAERKKRWKAEKEQRAQESRVRLIEPDQE